MWRIHQRNSKNHLEDNSKFDDKVFYGDSQSFLQKYLLGEFSSQENQLSGDYPDKTGDGEVEEENGGDGGDFYEIGRINYRDLKEVKV